MLMLREMVMRRLMRRGFAGRLAAAGLLVVGAGGMEQAHGYTYNASDFATTVASYTEGAGVGSDVDTGTAFNDPTVALGRPTVGDMNLGYDSMLPTGIMFPVVPIYPAYHATDIVSIGEGGSLVLEFDHPVYHDATNPGGVDFTVFGNSFLDISSGGYGKTNPQNVRVGAYTSQHGAVISVSQDGVNWYQVNGGAAVTGLLPTLGRTYDTVHPDSSLGTWNKYWGQPTDPTLPLAAGATFGTFANQTLAQIATTYGQSAGGTSFNITQATLAGAPALEWIQYVRIDNPVGSADLPSIDAVSIVASGNPWQGSAGSNWSVAGNWAGGVVPSGVDAVASFKLGGSFITGPIGVTVDTPRTVGAMDFDNPLGFAVTGTQAITLQASRGSAAITVTNGTPGAVSHSIGAPVIFGSPVTITVTAASTLTLSGPLTTGSNGLTKAGAGTLAVGALPGTAVTLAGGTMQLLANTGLSRVTGLTFSGGALDVNNDGLLDTGDALGTITAALKSGVLYTSAGSGGGIMGLAAVSGTDFLAVRGAGAQFYGSAVAPGNVVVKYTYIGDANLDGRITADDYVALDMGYLFGLSGWVNGDFTYAGSVGVADFAALDRSFLNQGDPLAETMIQQHAAWFGADYLAALGALPVSVPEPGALGLLMVGSWALCLRRKR